MNEQTAKCEVEEAQLREALLAEFRQDLILAKFDQLKIERIGVALRHGLITVPQAIALQHAPAGGLAT